MLKLHHYSAFFLSAILANNALAGCSTTVPPSTYRSNALRNALRNNTVCYPNHQEEHLGNGDIRDYKTGRDGDPIDLRAVVGTWEIINNDPAPATIVYTYSKGTDTAGPYTFTPHNNGGGSISFCNGNTEVVLATIIDGYGSGCP